MYETLFHFNKNRTGYAPFKDSLFNSNYVCKVHSFGRSRNAIGNKRQEDYEATECYHVNLTR